MLSAFPLALAQLGDPAVRRVLAKSIVLTLAIFAGLAALLGWALIGANPCAIGPLDYGCTIGGDLGTAAAVVLGVVALWFLFPAVAIAILGIFADDVVAAVERRHYPAAAAAARAPGIAKGAAMGLKSGGRILFWNLLASPFYLLLLFTAIGPFLLFTLVNALALGRDLGEMVAVRHLGGPGLEAWLAATRGRRAWLGVVTTGLFLIPFVNLLAPVLGAAMATHLFHKDQA